MADNIINAVHRAAAESRRIVCVVLVIKNKLNDYKYYFYKSKYKFYIFCKDM